MIKLTRPSCPNPSALARQNYNDARNKEALRQSTWDKCMYCESKISHIDHAHIEHIKPKAVDKFPQLEFDWNNLGYACAVCNISKSDKYDPHTPYIDPYIESPEDHLIAFGPFLFQRNGSERGELTIRDIDLNRPDLRTRRFEKIQSIQKALDACYRTSNTELRESALQSLRKEFDPDKEYSLIVETLLKAHG